MNKRFEDRFFPQETPSDTKLLKSFRIMIMEGAVASIIYTVAVNNIMAGYMSYLGASVSTYALIALIPQLGTVLQFVSPFLFERLHHRKLSIWILCMIYRFGVSATFLLPLYFFEGKPALRMAVILYAIAFACAGIVTPGLQQWTIGLMTYDKRGSFMAKKDIFAAAINSVSVLFLSRKLDVYIKAGNPEKAFFIIGMLCLVLSIADTLILINISERPVEKVTKTKLKDMLKPIQDESYRPLLIYNILGAIITGISAPFLIVYQIRVLKLSHTFLASSGILAALAGMLGSYFWGKYSDRNTWDKTIKIAACISYSVTLCWTFIRPGHARYFVPVLMSLATACGAGISIANLNLQYSASGDKGKTVYMGFTSAASSIAGSLATMISANLQPRLEKSIGYMSIAGLFMVSGVLGFILVMVYGRKLPKIK